MNQYPFTQVPADVFETLAKNAGVTLTNFNPETPQTGETLRALILWATDGGVTLSCVPRTIDNGEGIDNMPTNTKELLEIDGYDVTYSGTARTLKSSHIASLMGAADVETEGTGNAAYNVITPRMVVENADFKTLWHLVDYGNGGWIAVKIDNAFSTGGFSFKTENKGKASADFTYTGFTSIADISKVPMTVYVKEGTE